MTRHLAVLLAVVLPAGAGCSSTDFCSQTVKITFPPPTDAGCNLALVALDGGLAFPVIVPSNKTACEEAMNSCSSADQAILNDRVTCANDAGANPPACVDNQVTQWESAMDEALAYCINTNQVSSTCQGALNDAGT